MNRTISLRRWTASWLVPIWISTVCMTPGLARAEDNQPEPRPATVIVAPLAPAAAPAGPRVINDWQEGEPIPSGYHPSQRTRRGPIIAGVVTLGVLYFFSALIAAVSQDQADRDHTSNQAAGLYVPAVGPFITMTQSPTATEDFFLVLDGVAQTGAAVLLIYGLTSPQTVLVRDNYASAPRLMPKPMLLGKDGAGLGVVGSF
jgi:hypothetical protein